MTRRARRHSRGQALAEFALVLPIFALLVFGLIDVGRAVYVNNAASQAAREGARWGSVQGRSSDAAGRASIVSHTIGTMNAVPDPQVTVTCEDGQLCSVTFSVAETVSVIADPSPPSRIALPEQLVLARERYGR